jgi:hypothetical protein
MKDQSTKGKDVSRTIWLSLVLVGIGIILWGIFSKPERNNLWPPGGLMETAKDSAEYRAALAATAAMTTEENPSSPTISKELLSTTSDFNFDNKIIRFKPGEREKIVQLEPGKTSPRIFIPWDKSGYVKLIDSTEVWGQNGIKYMDTPDARHRLPDRMFRLTGRQPVRIVLR